MRSHRTKISRECLMGTILCEMAIFMALIAFERNLLIAQLLDLDPNLDYSSSVLCNPLSISTLTQVFAQAKLSDFASNLLVDLAYIFPISFNILSSQNINEKNESLTHTKTTTGISTSGLKFKYHCLI